MYHNWYATWMRIPVLDIYFYKTEQGNEPVREWLQQLSSADKKRIGDAHEDGSIWLAIRNAAGEAPRWRYLGGTHSAEQTNCQGALRTGYEFDGTDS